MTIPTISPSIEKPFRKALGRALRNEIDELQQELQQLTDEQFAYCVSLCALVSGHVAIDACGKQWPDADNLRRLGKAPTKSKNARAFGLREEDAYTYIKRVALGGERLDLIFPSMSEASTLSFVITGHLVVAFSKYEEEWWEYLDRIEVAYEVAQVADLDMLPALMLRSRRSAASVDPEKPSGTGAASS